MGGDVISKPINHFIAASINEKVADGEARKALLDDPKWISHVAAELGKTAALTRADGRFDELMKEIVRLSDALNSKSQVGNPAQINSINRNIERLKPKLDKAAGIYSASIRNRVILAGAFDSLAQLKDARVIALMGPFLVMDNPGRTFSESDYVVPSAPECAINGINALRASGIPIPGAENCHTPTQWSLWWRKNRHFYQKMP